MKFTIFNCQPLSAALALGRILSLRSAKEQKQPRKKTTKANDASRTHHSINLAFQQINIPALFVDTQHILRYAYIYIYIAYMKCGTAYAA